MTLTPTTTLSLALTLTPALVLALAPIRNPPSEPDMLYDPVTDPNIYPGEEGYDPLIHGDLGLDPEGAG